MAVLTEGNRLSDVLAWEQENLYSREKITILSGQVLAVGQVVGQVSASGKYVAFNQDATDGSQIPAGIVIADYDATGADIAGVIIARDAILRPSGLVWPSDIETAEKEAAMAVLEEAGILTNREEA